MPEFTVKVSKRLHVCKTEWPQISVDLWLLRIFLSCFWESDRHSYLSPEQYTSVPTQKLITNETRSSEGRRGEPRSRRGKTDIQAAIFYPLLHITQRYPHFFWLQLVFTLILRVACDLLHVSMCCVACWSAG